MLPDAFVVNFLKHYTLHCICMKLTFHLTALSYKDFCILKVPLEIMFLLNCCSKFYFSMNLIV